VLETLYYDMHFLDVELLRHQLLESVLHLHSQPPLFNLFLGVLLKLSPAGHEQVVFAAVYMAMGLAIVLLAYEVMHMLAVDSRWALTVAGALVLFPSMTQAETWLYYTYPVTLFLIAGAWTLGRFFQTRSLRWFAVFSLILTATVLTRSAYHLVLWMTPLLVGAVLLASRAQIPRWRQAILWAIVAWGLASSVYVRNALTYGQFASSTWFGYSLNAVTGYLKYAYPDKIEHLVQTGRITPLARIERMSSPEDYMLYYKTVPTPTGIQALDAPYKEFRYPDSGKEAVNYNYPLYSRASKEYARNAIQTLSAYPWAYLLSVLNQTYIYFGFSPYRFFFDVRAFAVPRQDTWRHTVYDVIMVYAVPPVFFAGFWGVVWIFFRRMRNASQDPLAHALYGYMVFTILYVTAISIGIELGEGNYLRIPIDPLLAVGVAVGLSALWRKRRRP